MHIVDGWDGLRIALVEIHAIGRSWRVRDRAGGRFLKEFFFFFFNVNGPYDFLLL